MHVAVDARFLAQPMSGVQRYARELCAALDVLLEERDPVVADLEVTLLHPPLAGAAPTYRHLGLRQVGRLSGQPWEQLSLPRAARRYDVLLCPGNLAPLASLRGRTPVVTTVHDLAFRYHPETVSRAFRTVYEVVVPQVLAHSARVITVSEAERERMLEHFPGAAGRLVAVANGGSSPVQTGALPHPEPPAGDFVLYVGALNQRKNVDGVLSTIRRLLDERDGLRAVLIGASAAAYSPVELGGLDERVLALGAVDEPTLDAHYRAASLMLFPSFHEASGLPPVEAMARGCPVVVSDIPALRERCGDAAEYCLPYDVDSIVAAARRVLDDRERRDELVALGHARAAGFTWERTARETVAVLRDAVASSR